MRSLITGIAGFAGRHLAALLLAHGDEVYGVLHREESRAQLDDLAKLWPGLAERLTVADVTDAHALARVVADVRPACPRRGAEHPPA